MSRPFIRGQVAIDSMRDNGFLSAAHALAEIIDNSIQAEATSIDLIAFESNQNSKSKTGKPLKRIEKIGIFDNGRGMDKETLHLALEFGSSENYKDDKGIGKFGMGLPNSSISQCKRVEVWSWKSPQKIAYTYLDIDEIKNGDLETIPEPEYKEISPEILSALDEKLPPHGTLVLWSKIDRCQWKTGSSIYKHTQNIVGRMYRYFINSGKVTIKYKATEFKENLFMVDGDPQVFLANDPLYLMKNTSLPELPGDFIEETLFEHLNDCHFPVPIEDENGIEHQVIITGTVLKKSIADEMRKHTTQNIGNTEWGKHAKSNMGLSIVRANRELAQSQEFLKQEGKLKGWARWYSIEVKFPPALDNIFGVTNNKQHAVNLKMIRISDDYESEGFSSDYEYESDLKLNNDPKLKIYKLVQKIKEVEEKLIARVKTLKFGKIPKESNKPTINGGVNQKINEKNKKREEIHPTGPLDITREQILEELAKIGADNATEKADEILNQKLQVWTEEVPMATNAFFDVSTTQGFTLLQINTNHIFYTKIFNKLPSEQKEALEVCLGGWARMERECENTKRVRQLEMARRDWGQLLDDYLDEEDEHEPSAEEPEPV